MSEPFRHRFRVRYAELDPQGVVFNARYLEYADLVVTEYWRARQLRMFGEDALEFHVAHADVNFRKPIRADEEIEGRAWTTRIGNSSMTTRIELHGVQPDGSDDLRAEIELVNVHVALETGQSLPIPDSARAALLNA
ncbi:thioesterase family protein [Pontixanthobacter aestiaquae]|uniref:Acyl-CoA thioesterase n=1 Tax=Pontixanthobacter aestiaquae TaxID=1509367 RepID=A0A844YZS9_9SPHN|nr:thioesterase family protein [Pontixanthobacter aestiaquae]MDN3647041.1 thioesterase family protein [Pontixanthobacter aestiaquae]MXO81981.1 acyl-CoA thioesterase [Pontixanthobacter aestiaquae]